MSHYSRMIYLLWVVFTERGQRVNWNSHGPGLWYAGPVVIPEGHIEIKFRECLFAYNYFFFNSLVIQKSCTVLVMVPPCVAQNINTIGQCVGDEQDFARFQLKMNFGGIPYIATALMESHGLSSGFMAGGHVRICRWPKSGLCRNNLQHHGYLLPLIRSTHEKTGNILYLIAPRPY